MQRQNSILSLRRFAYRFGLLLGLLFLLTNASCLDSPDKDQHEVKTLTGHNAAVRAVAFSPDGAILASGSEDALVRLWDMTTLHATTCDAWEICSPWGSIAEKPQSPILPMRGTINALAFSKDGAELALGLAGKGTGLVVVYRISDGKEIATLEGFSHEVQALAYSPDGAYLAAGSGSEAPGAMGELALWNAAGKAPLWNILSQHIGGVRGLAFSPDGKWIVTFGTDKHLVVRDATSGLPFADLSDFDSAPSALAFDAAKGLLAVSSQDKQGDPIVDLFSLSDWKRITRFNDAPNISHALLFSPETELGTTLASAAENGKIRLYRVHEENEAEPLAVPTVLETFYGHSGRINSLSHSPARNLLASGGNDGNVILWNVSSFF